MQITTKYSARVENMSAAHLEAELMASPCTSYTLQHFLGEQSGRDCVDALRDAELALAVAHKRVAEALGRAGA